MSKFKVGQRVKVKGVAWNGNPGSSIDSRWPRGTLLTIAEYGNAANGKSAWDVLFKEGGYADDQMLVLAEPTLDTLSVGDEVGETDGTSRKVLAVLGELIGLSCVNRPDVFSNWYTVAELKEEGHTVKSTEPEIKELTMDEVAKLAGVPVGSVRIKKEAE